jgi:hypothetical protein
MLNKLELEVSVSINFTIETSDATRVAQDKSHMWLSAGG